MSNTADHLLIENIRVPRFLYGTAWKEESTRRLTELAISAGFSAIDTANQRRHYHEAAVGEAVAASTEKGIVNRSDLFLQTKFTFQGGQDHRLPYDANAPVATQVEQSFASSLEHLRTDVIDSFLLHGPMRREGLGTNDWAAWQAMEAMHDTGRAQLIGVSNVSLAQLKLLCASARVRPHFVQNRCFASTGWDRQVRRFCDEAGIVYQGFSLLTANRETLAHPEMVRIAHSYGRSVGEIVFRFALEVGMIPLTGTTNEDHMRVDLSVFDFSLSAEEVERIERTVAR